MNTPNKKELLSNIIRISAYLDKHNHLKESDILLKSLCNIEESLKNKSAEGYIKSVKLAQNNTNLILNKLPKNIKISILNQNNIKTAQTPEEFGQQVIRPVEEFIQRGLNPSEDIHSVTVPESVGSRANQWIKNNPNQVKKLGLGLGVGLGVAGVAGAGDLIHNMSADQNADASGTLQTVNAPISKLDNDPNYQGQHGTSKDYIGYGYNALHRTHDYYNAQQAMVGYMDGKGESPEFVKAVLEEFQKHFQNEQPVQAESEDDQQNYYPDGMQPAQAQVDQAPAQQTAQSGIFGGGGAVDSSSGGMVPTVSFTPQT